jgi:hypothetical protein
VTKQIIYKMRALQIMPKVAADRAIWLLAIALVMLSLPAGVSASQVSSGTPPLVICGQTLDTGAAGPQVLTFLGSGRFDLRGGLRAERPPAIPEVLRFVSSCKSGVRIAIEPRGVLTIQWAARAEDHTLAAIAVVGRRRGTARIVATRDGGQKTIVTVHVRPAEPYNEGRLQETT